MVNYTSILTKVIMAALVGGGSVLAVEQLSSSAVYTNATSKFGPFIEGVGVTAAGSVYAVNFGDAKSQFQIGQVYPTQELALSDATLGHPNGMSFISKDEVLVPDAMGKRVLKVNIQSKRSTVFCENPDMLQPNDIAVTGSGILFASGMKYTADTTDKDGDLWMCQGNKATKIATMGRTNGIAISPDDGTVYISESKNVASSPSLQKVWRYSVKEILQGNYEKELFVDYGKIEPEAVKYDIDGMRTDTSGNLYVTRNGQGKIDVFEPTKGQLIKSIKVSFPYTSSLEFGGTTGSTLFVVGRCTGYDTYGVGIGCVDKIDLPNTVGTTWSHLNRNNKPAVNELSSPSSSSNINTASPKKLCRKA